MRFSVLLTFSILSGTLAIGQVDTTCTSFINNIIVEKQDTAKIYYVDSIIYFRRLSNLKRLINKGTFSQTHNGVTLSEITLTNQEREHIIQSLNTQKNKKWADSLFPNSETILTKYFITKAIELNKPYYSGKTLKHKYTWHFTMPIFFRNNNFAFIQYVYLCGNSCGEEVVAFYKQIDGQWEEWLVIAGGVF